MDLRIDFYSKNEVAIRIDLSGRYPFPANETGELFLLACYTLRQLSNLGGHEASRVLALLLASYTKNTAIEIPTPEYEFPSLAGLQFLMGYHGSRFNVHYEALRMQIFRPIPRHVQYRGDGKKAFYVRLPPFHLTAKGFGLLGYQVNFYAFHSVLALSSHLAESHIDEEAYLQHLAAVAQYCGKAHIAGAIPLGDHVRLANAILKEAGVTS